MATDLDAAHIFVSREQARALVGVGRDMFGRWIAAGEIPVYLIAPADNHQPGRQRIVFRLANVYAAKRRARAAA